MNKTIKKFLPKAVGFRLNSLFLLRPEAAIEKAFQLFCSPRRGKVDFEQAVFLDPAKIEPLHIEGTTIQMYHWPGEKETILLLHGWESNVQRWKTLIEILQHDGYTIFAFDAPAHGNSSGKMFNVPFYSVCMEEVLKKFRPKYVIAHSVGAMTAVYNQYKHPEETISKMVLLGPPSELTALMKDFQKILNLSPRFMTAFEQYFKKKFGFLFSEFSTATFAKNLVQKGLIVHDAYDKIVPVSAAKSIHANWKNSTLIITEGAGHSLNQKSIYTAISEFLKT